MGSQRELTRLHEILAERFDAEDLRTLYFRLGIGYDDLGGEGKLGKARELVTFLERRGRIGELIATGKQLRPDVAWDVEDAATPSPTPILRPERLQEIIVTGSLEHFQGLMEFEQLTNPTYAGYIYENKSSVYTYGPIAGTTAHKIASVYWLVITGVNIVMDDRRMGSATGSCGSFGYLWFTPDMTLDDMDREAQKLNVRLSETLDAGEVRVTELPRGRIRVRFVLSKFPNPSLFWMWVDYLVQEMERQGFI